MSYNSLSDVLTASARNYPQRTAIVFGRKKITYKQLNDLVSEVACGLVGLGIKKGEKVALFLDNSPEFVAGYYAILKAGAVAVPINYMFKKDETKFILEDSRACAIITSRAYVGLALELRTRLDCLKHVITSDFKKVRKHHPRALEKVPGQAHELAVILYTSGTTGSPKGAMLSHYNLISNADDSAAAIKTTCRDAFICILPLFHSFAATVCMNLPLSKGAKIVIMKSVRPFKRVIRAIRRNRVTIFVGVPSIYAILKNMKLPKIFRGPLIKLFNPVKVCISGAAALPTGTFHGFERKFRIPLLEGYGLTEASPVVTLNPLAGPRKAGSIGVSLSKRIKLKVVNDRGDELSHGRIGELLVRGPNVMRGYYKQEEASAEVLRDGWLYTGDMAEFDKDGYFYIVGRKKEMVNVRGLNVYPREIEEALYQNQKVKEAAVIGVADEHKGEVPKGFVVLKEGESATEHEIIQYLRDKLASYKIPKYIVFRDSLPKNTTGKILKRLLQDEEKNK